MIDFLKIKLNPLILGRGIKLVGSSKKKILTELVDIKSYNEALQIINYRVNYQETDNFKVPLKGYKNISPA